MSQKALLLSKIGEDLILSTRQIPNPKENQVLVKILISSINPHDGSSKSQGTFVANSLPTPLATECIGKVEKLGSGVSKFAVGDIIFAFGDPFQPDEQYSQEYGIVTVSQAAKLPKNISPDEALTFPLNAQTVFFALFHSSGFGLPPTFIKGSSYPAFDYANSTIVIIGGGAATGKFAIELCRLAGFGKIITIASLSSKKLLLSLGATHVIDRTLSDDALEDSIRGIVGDELILALDVFNHGTHQSLGARFLSTTKRGVLVSIIAAGSVDESQFREPKKAGYERKFVFVNAKAYTDVAEPFWANIVHWIENGDLKPTKWSVIDGLDAKKVNAALDGYVRGENVVKPHLHIAEE
jgi:NADPH2:quinone reductase